MKRIPLKRILGVFIIIIFFYFIIKSLYENWYNLKEAKLRFEIYYLLLSYIMMFITFILVAFTWKKNLQMLNENISLITAIKINAISVLPKYAPGKVWGIIGKVYLAKKEGISEHSSVITISLETILYLLSGIILFLVTSLSIIKSNFTYLYYLLIIPICLIAIYPPILIRITNFFLKLFKRPTIDIMPHYYQILILLLLYMLSWILQGIGVFFLISSFYSIPFKSILIISGLHAFSWVVGFLSIIAPAGLGVKEGIFSYFLSYILPVGIAAISSLLVRIWGTIGELLYFLIFSTKLKKYL
ncbi:MAG: lysylphosphatidylglycerol synthase domain-containing protein [candidate division WOR-3 bacterium]